MNGWRLDADRKDPHCLHLEADVADRDPEAQDVLDLIQACLESLEAKGLVVRTGELRPGGDGKLYPVWRLVPRLVASRPAAQPARFDC